MHRNVRHFLLGITWLALLGITAFMGPGCSDNGDPAEPWAPTITFEEVQEIVIDRQQVEYDHFLDLLTAGADTAAALDSVQAVFANDPNVEWAVASDQGVFVQYLNGLWGGIFVDPLDFPDSPAGEPLKAMPVLPSRSERSPDKAAKKAVFFNPHYSDRIYWSDLIIQRYTDMLPAAGFGPLTTYLNEAASLDQLADLSGYDLVHLYSHGVAFPSTENREAVLLMTSTELSRDVFETYGEDFEKHRLICLTATLGATCFVTSEYITRHNDLSGGDVLVFGGFCFSNVGDWPSAMMDEGVGGYFGFDWIVRTSNCNTWALSLMTDLLDTGPAQPLTTNDWMSNSIPKWYWEDLHGDRPVSIEYTGDARLTLLEETLTTTCEESDTGSVSDGYVAAFGTYYSRSGSAGDIQVKYLYKKIHCDGSVGTAGPYYGVTDSGGGFYSPMTAIMSLGNHQEQVVVEVTIQNYTKRVVIDFDDFFDDLTGRTLFTPRKVGFIFGQ